MYRSSPFDRETNDRGFRRHPHQPGLAGKDPELVARRSHQAGDDQLPHLQAGARRPVLRPHLRAGDRLGVLVRQVQAHEAPRRDLRQVRRGSDALQGAPRAPGPHRAGFAVLARLVLQGPAQPHRPPARHLPARPGVGAVLRGLRGGRSGRRAGERARDHQGRDEVPRTGPAVPSHRLQGHDGRRGDQGTAEARRYRGAVRRAAREDEERDLAAEAARSTPSG